MTRHEADADRLLERLLLGQLGLDQGDDTASTSASVTARRKARRAKSRRMRSASASGVVRDDLDAVAVVVDRRRRLRQVAEDAAVALPAARCRCSGPSTSTHWTASPGPSYLSAPILWTVWALGQAVGEDRDGRPRLHVLDELDDGRLVGRGVEVADQVRSCPPIPPAGRSTTRKVTGLPAL